MLYYNYQNVPPIEVRITVYRGKTTVREDFNRAKLFVWLVSSHDMIPVSVTAENGTITFNPPTTLDMGVYGIKAIWTKELGFNGKPSIRVPYGMEIHADKTSRADISSLFAIVSDTAGTTDDGIIETSIEVATYGYDGLDAYEMAVLNGFTKLSKKEWLESRSLTAVLQNEGNNTEASMSQAAITEALNKLRSVLGAGYRSKGKVDTLPKVAEQGDLFCLSSNMHTYGCVGHETEQHPILSWGVNDGTQIDAVTQEILDTITTNSVRGLSCSSQDFPYFKLDFTNGRFVLVACDEDGNIIDHTPVHYLNGSLRYGPGFDSETDVVYATVIGQTNIGDAIYQDFGLLQTIDYIPKARDTEYVPSATSMLGDTDNVQDGLDKVARVTPSMEQNLVLAANRNAQAVNANFQNLLTRYNKIIEVLQTLIDRVDFHTPEGFRDIADLIASISFESLTTIRRVTSGGSFSEDTSVSGAAVCGTAVSGII
ncbi:MAG: hypothetical protein J6Y15_10340 [Bacteroidaceae bacterium]|nr:hypothetical protein [Bacteroidaceae bacterium]